MRQNSARRRWAAVLAFVVAIGGLVVAGPTPATAAPGVLAAPGDNGDDGEGGSKSLIEQLEAASKGFVEAKEALAKSKTKQAELVAVLKKADAELGPRQAALDKIAAEAYRTGRLGPMSALLTASSTGSLMDRAQTLETVGVKQDRALRALKETRDKQAAAKAAIDAQIAEQQKQVTAMAKRKAQAEDALKAVNQGQDTGSPGGGSGGTAKARPGSGGSGCSVTDPTKTGGCITPRLDHAYDEARRVGFKRYTKCYRSQRSGEHGKGRACDFSAHAGTFGGDATGADKTYGTNLANFFIKNSDTLGVLYVIWYRRIWLPSSGWKSYSGAGGDPSSDHTNHVHLSVR